MRIVDLPRALSIRPYPVTGEITFRVRDQLCEWNEATWNLQVGPEGADIRQTDADPELTLDIHSLAQLATGHLSATYLARLNRIETNTPPALQRADNIFATPYRLHSMNHF